eukprot:572293_1
MADITNQVYQLSDSESTCFIVDAFIMSPLGILLCIYYLFELITPLRRACGNHNHHYRSALLCAVLSFISSLIVYLFKVFISNDLLIPWTFFTLNQRSFVSVSDAQFIFFSGLQTVGLYCSFTFFAQSLSGRDKMSFMMKFAMIGLCVMLAVSTVIFIFLDALIYNPKQIGYAKNDDFHISMYLGHEPVNWTFALTLSIIVQCLYLCYLLYVHITGLRDMRTQGSINVYMNDTRDARPQGFKAVVLLMLLFVLFCANTVTLPLQLEIRFILSSSVFIGENICLFLMFKHGRVYNIFCGYLCNNCCVKMIYGIKYQAVYDDDDDDDDEYDDSEDDTYTDANDANYL